MSSYLSSLSKAFMHRPSEGSTVQNGLVDSDRTATELSDLEAGLRRPSTERPIGPSRNRPASTVSVASISLDEMARSQSEAANTEMAAFIDKSKNDIRKEIDGLMPVLKGHASDASFKPTSSQLKKFNDSLGKMAALHHLYTKDKATRPSKFEPEDFKGSMNSRNGMLGATSFYVKKYSASIDQPPENGARVLSRTPNAPERTHKWKKGYLIAGLAASAGIAGGVGYHLTKSSERHDSPQDSGSYPIGGNMTIPFPPVSYPPSYPGFNGTTLNFTTVFNSTAQGEGVQKRFPLSHAIQ